MNGLSAMRACRKISRLAKNNGPLIGMITAGVGFTGSIIETARATVKAVRHTDRVEKDRGTKLTGSELVGENWHFYISSILLWIGSIMSLCFSAKGYKKSIKSLAALYAASESARKNIEEQAREALGDRKYEELQDDVAQKTLEKNPVRETGILATGHGEHLCFDSLTGRYFRCNIDWIKRAVNNFNNRICVQKCGYSYDDLFDEISPSFDPTIFGRNVGWGPNRGVADIRYSSKIASNGEPCLVMQYRLPPYADFDM